MISGSEFVELLVARFHECGFSPYLDSQSGSKDRKELFFHEGIRGVLGMRDDDSIYMYWEWRQLKTAFDAMWAELDIAASKIDGRVTTAIALCSRPEVTVNDVVALLGAVNTGKLVDFPRTFRRPTKSEGQVRFIGKRLGAILMTLGVVVDATNSGYGDHLSSASYAAHDDIQLLEYLDGLVFRELGDPHEAKPPTQVVILRALGWAYEKVNESRLEEDLSEFSFAEFLRETEASANWSGLTDQMVLRRLLTIAPEKADASKKAIEKYLSK